MINQTIDKLTIAILAAAALSLTGHSAEKKTAAPAPEKTAAASTEKSAADAEKATMFRGQIASVDKDAKTITLANKKGKNTRTFTVGDNAKLMKAKNETATWADLTVGEKVHGTFQKSADGKMEVLTLKVGAKAEAKAGKTEKAAVEKTDAKPTETKKQ